MSRRRPLIVGAVSAVLVILLMLFLVLPKMGEVDRAKQELTAAEQQEQQLQLQLQQLREAQSEAPQATEEIRRLEEQVPPTADLPGLILLLSGAANDAGVDFFTMAPGTPTPGTTGQFSVIPTQVTVTGSYFAIEEFLYNIETLQRAGKVLSLSLAPGGEAATTETTAPETTETATAELSTQLSMEFYTTNLSAGPGSAPDATPSPEVAATPTPPAPGV